LLGGGEQPVAEILDGIVIALTQRCAARGIAAVIVLVAQRLERGNAPAALAPTNLALADHALGVLEEQAIAASTAIGLHRRRGKAFFERWQPPTANDVPMAPFAVVAKSPDHLRTSFHVRWRFDHGDSAHYDWVHEEER
jgi:hypothetical protein